MNQSFGGNLVLQEEKITFVLTSHTRSGKYDHLRGDNNHDLDCLDFLEKQREMRNRVLQKYPPSRKRLQYDQIMLLQASPKHQYEADGLFFATREHRKFVKKKETYYIYFLASSINCATHLSVRSWWSISSTKCGGIVTISAPTAAARWIWSTERILAARTAVS